MSLKERDRLSLFSRVREGQMTLMEASLRLKLSYRQAKRLWRRYREVGDAGLVHGLRGRRGNNRPGADARRERALELYRHHYEGFGPTLAAEQLAAREGLVVNHETLRGWLTWAGLWKPRRDQRRRHPRRPRRGCLGELVQIDGSEHAWLGKDRPRCCLMVMIDDATGLTHARFFESETTVAVMTILREWVLAHGLPRALYPDRHSIHRRNDQAADEVEHRTGKRPLTRLGEALEELGVELIWAGSPQAKGRVERMNSTLQDRLVKMLKLEGITTIEAANAYLTTTFLPQLNARFMVKPADARDAHRRAPWVEELDAVLCPVRERRVVSQDGWVSWRGRCWELLGSDATPRHRRQVQVCQRLDGTVELREVRGGRVLASRERQVDAPRPESPAKPPLTQRVAAHAGPTRPAADHPWRGRALAGAGCATDRGCAPPLRSPGPSQHQQGTLLPG